MRVLICPDKFAGTLSAPQVAEAIAEGWGSVAAESKLTRRPLADGGPGFVEVLAAALGGTRVPVETVDPLGRPVTGEVLVVGDTAYVESAQACGLHLLSKDERDPKLTTSGGLGILISAAAETGARTVVVGLGGSATNDGGAGMLTTMHVLPMDGSGRHYVLPYGGRTLPQITRIDDIRQTRGVRLVAATDVDNPLCGLHGASNVFGPQKGATREDVLMLDAALEHFAAIMVRDIKGCPPDVRDMPGAGAAGGIGAAIFALGGTRESGVDLVRSATGLDAALDEADLVITGEGSFDFQSLRGKLVSGVAAAATERGIPCVVVAGQVSVGRREAASAGITETHSLVEHFGTVDEAMAKPAEGLRALAARLAGQWDRPSG